MNTTPSSARWEQLRQRLAAHQQLAADAVEQRTWRERTQRVAHPTPVASAPQAPTHWEVSIAAERCYLPFHSLTGALRPEHIAHWPWLPPWLAGVAAYEGHLLAVLALEHILFQRLAPAPAPAAHRTLSQALIVAAAAQPAAPRWAIAVAEPPRPVTLLLPASQPDRDIDLYRPLPNVGLVLQLPALSRWLAEQSEALAQRSPRTPL